MSDKKYKWASPAEWLLERMSDPDVDRADLYGELRTLVEHIDSDTLQDIYQDEMQQDGYFDALCPHGHILEYADCEQCGEVEESKGEDQ